MFERSTKIGAWREIGGDQIVEDIAALRCELNGQRVVFSEVLQEALSSLRSDIGSLTPSLPFNLYGRIDRCFSEQIGFARSITSIFVLFFRHFSALFWLSS